MAISPEEKNRRTRERRKQRYADEPEFREKALAENRAYRLKNADAISTRRRARKYGLSPKEYAAMVTRQRGVCVICLKLPERGLVIDHDHKTGKLRDLLCDQCNVGLGNYKHDSAVLRRGGDYLDFWQWGHAHPGNTGPLSFATGSLHAVLARTPRPIRYPAPKGEDMTDDTAEDGKPSRMMRRAILHELLQPFEPDPPPPVHMLQAVSRAIVIKASQGDMTAAKEVFDQIDGKTAAAVPASAEIPNEMFFRWRRPT